MSYKIDYTAALQAVFLSADIRFILFFIGIIGFIITYILYKSQNKWTIIKGIAALVIFAMAIQGSAEHAVGSGWQLNDSQLSVKAWPVSKEINLKSAQILLADSSSQWQPVVRTNGYGISGLRTGWFKLRNGKEAVVFSHLSTDKLLVIKSGDCYYILVHPGVELLYNKLVSQGVSVNDL